MSSDPTPFQAPERYPDPPKDMYYEVPKTPTYQKPTPIFPWEKNAPKATRVFPEDNLEPEPSNDTSISEDKKSPVLPTVPAAKPASTESWHTFPHVNAWDDIPEIERYIGHLQRNRKGSVQVLQSDSGIPQLSSPGGRIPGTKLTDFPTELERPSLPVTPAPIRRPSFWGEKRDDEGELPAAEGVPSQQDWVSLSVPRVYSTNHQQDPEIQLEQLARRQSEVLSRKLGSDTGSPREIPLRSLPFGSERITSPTYKAPRPPASSSAAEPAPTQPIAEPAYQGPSATWEKDETFPTQETPAPPSEEEKDVLET
jgi:glycogenin glucosyltransferase